MVAPITAVYAQEKDEWTVTVTGLDKTLTGRAAGIIAARDRTDQLVEKLVKKADGTPTVVHLLNGSALEFTSVYMTARLTRTEEPTNIETVQKKRSKAAPKSTTTRKPRSRTTASKSAAKDESASPKTRSSRKAASAEEEADAGPTRLAQ